MNAIVVKNLSKTFKLPHQKVDSLREGFSSVFQKKTYEEFKALNNVSFEVKKGEFFGVIGRNGSGKSTLLKILAEIYQPNKGSVKINGKVSPFLELGVGFNPELTAKENVFLNGVVLGLPHREIEHRYPEIVKFSGLKKFMDTKLKNFSSGMQVRLAFSVAIQADADIYLIDEVLAVGDSEFQEKCYEIFRQFKKEGKTIVFVSHDLASINELCGRVILLEFGRVLNIGTPQKITTRYQVATAQRENKEKTIIRSTLNHTGTGDVLIKKIIILNQVLKPTQIFSSLDKIIIRVYYEAKKKIQKPVFGIALYSESGIHITGPNTKSSDYNITSITKGNHWIDYIINSIPLLADTYYVSVGVFDWSCRVPFDFVEKATYFRVLANLKNQFGIVKFNENWENG